MFWAVTLCKELNKLLILQGEIKTLSAAQLCRSERETRIFLSRRQNVNSSIEIL